MMIGVIGAGQIGRAVATNFAKNGLKVLLANRTPEKAQQVAAQIGENVTAVSVDEAVRQADVLILAIWFADEKSFIHKYFNELRGKLVIDPSNPITVDSEGNVSRTLPEGVSSGKIIATLLPEDTLFAKAFGTLGAETLATSSNQQPEKVALYFAADTEAATDKVTELIAAAGFLPIKVGETSTALAIEVGGALHQLGGLENQLPTEQLAKEKLAEFLLEPKADNVALLKEFLTGAFDLNTLEDTVKQLVAEDAEYISLNFENPVLKQIEPWTGTNYGQQAFIDNFSGVLNQWEVTSFEIQLEMQQGDYAMVFGKFSLKSKTLGQEASSPMSAIAKIDNHQLTRFIYLEDTLATAFTFKAGGSSVFHTEIGKPGFSL